MNFWNKVGDILELLGRRLQTPEYLMCCGVESRDTLILDRRPADTPGPTSVPREKTIVEHRVETFAELNTRKFLNLRSN